MTLPDYITQNLERKFVWGEWDCVLCANQWVTLKTGIDPLGDFPKWTSQHQALRAMKKAGGLEAAIDARFKRINPNAAKDGDIALINGCVCIFSGAHVVGPGDDGLKFNDRTEAHMAWSIS